MNREALKNLLIQERLLDADRLRELDALSVTRGTTLLDTVISGSYVREEALLPLVAKSLGMEWLTPATEKEMDAALYEALPAPLRAPGLPLPIRREEGVVWVAVADPLDLESMDRLHKATAWKMAMRLAGRERIAKLRDILEKAAGRDAAPTLEGVETVSDRSAEDMANDAPLIKLVNLIIMQAISMGASDIHVEPYENRAVVRYRVDGILSEISTYPRQQYPAIISRIKIMADLNIAERRIPQDGRISIRLMDHVYDLRVAIIPTLHGEGAVLRILDKGSIALTLGQLGFAPGNLALFNRMIARPHGMVLVTGPTGSGKTTTLYAALSAIKSVENKIITIEDPVEYDLEGISQIHVNTKVGLSFAAGLRSILRLDPDIVMVGEIRDAETAEIAIRSALTGHLVLSTLHTNDAPAAITRLIDMGVETFLIGSSLNGVQAQRLVRRICRYCKKEVPATAAEVALLSPYAPGPVSTVFRGAGCDECGGSGYAGRLGIHEVFELTPGLRELVNRRASTAELREAAKAEGMRTLREDGLVKALAGLTTPEEIVRATEMD